MICDLHHKSAIHVPRWLTSDGMLLLRPMVLKDALSFALVANPVRSVLPRGYQGKVRGLGVRGALHARRSGSRRATT